MFLQIEPKSLYRSIHYICMVWGLFEGEDGELVYVALLHWGQELVQVQHL